MSDCFPFIKYFYLLVLFLVSFIALKNLRTEVIGFGATFALQSIYTLVLLFEIAKDTNRADKSITIPIPTTPVTPGYDINIPLYFILVPCVSMQFAAALMMVLSMYAVYKQQNSIKISRNDRWSIDAYKNMFMVATFALMFLTYVYMSDFTNIVGSKTFSGGYKMLMLMAVLISIFLSMINVLNANHQTRLITSMTDG